MNYFQKKRIQKVTTTKTQQLSKTKENSIKSDINQLLLDI